MTRKVETPLEWRRPTWKSLIAGSEERAKVRHVSRKYPYPHWITGTISIYKIKGKKGHKKAVTFIKDNDASFILYNVEPHQMKVLRPIRKEKQRSQGAF